MSGCEDGPDIVSAAPAEDTEEGDIAKLMNVLLGAIETFPLVLNGHQVMTALISVAGESHLAIRENAGAAGLTPEEVDAVFVAGLRGFADRIESGEWQRAAEAIHFPTRGSA